MKKSINKYLKTEFYLNLLLLLFISLLISCDSNEFFAEDKRNLRETEDSQTLVEDDQIPETESAKAEPSKDLTVEVEPQPEPKPETEPVKNQLSAQEPKVEVKPEPISQPEPETKTEPEPVETQLSVQKPEVEPEPEPKPAPVSISVVPVPVPLVIPEKPIIAAPKPIVTIKPTVTEPKPEPKPPVVFRTAPKPVKYPALAKIYAPKPKITVTYKKKPEPVIATFTPSPQKMPELLDYPSIKTAAPTVVISPNSPTIETLTQSFSTAFDRIQVPVDLLFTIDNSESMNDEVKSIYNNLEEFLDKLSNYSNTKIGILTAFDQTGAIVTFNNNGTVNQHPPLNYSQSQITKISRRVRSYNGLALISDFIRDKLNTESGTKLAIQGSNFFRKQSLKVIVMVTDDDAKDLGADAFIKEIFETMPVDNTRFFAFVGIPSEFSQTSSQYPYLHFASTSEKQNNCTIYNEGQEYFALITSYIQGALFDLCLNDWSAHFSTIADYVITSVRSQYALEHHSSKILDVLIENQSIASSDFILRDYSIEFNTTVLPSNPEDEKMIEIIYRK